MDWVSWAPTPPAALESAGFVANASSGSGVLFGGLGAAGLSDATYLYSETSNLWTTAAPTTAPSARSDFGFGFNAATDAAVLFGGETNTATQAVSNATWEFDLASGEWTNVPTSVAPAAREDPAFAVGDGIALLYGGWAQNVSGFGELTYSDTWVLNLSTDLWTQVHPSGGTPGAIHGASLLWQPTLDEFLLFGGCYPCSSNVWAFSPANQTWQRLTVVSGVPPPRMDATWVWDPAAGVDVLFGGTNGTTVYGSTYYYQPGIPDWTVASTSATPPARYDAAAGVLDASDNASVFLTGGVDASGPLGDVWRLAEVSNLTVKVVDSATGLGIANATVQAGPDSGLLTNATGFATAYSLPSNVTAVTATQAGYSPRSTAVWLPPGVSVEISLSLPPLPPATVEVSVKDPSGNPVAGAYVALAYGTRPLPDSPQVTGASGEVEYTDVPAANYTLTVNRTGDHTSTTSIDAASGSTVQSNITLSPLYLLAIRTSARLPNGTVVTAAGVELSVDGKSVGVSPANGSFNRSLDAVGTVTVVGTLYGFYNASGSVNATFTGVGYVNLTLHAQPYPVITIEILGQRGNGPGFQVRAANVTVTNTSALATGPFRSTFVTNVEGTVTFSPPTGNYSVTVSAVGFVTNDSIPKIVAPPGANLSRTYYLSLIGFSNIVVLILSAATGNPPIGGAAVALRFLGTNLSTGLPFPNESRLSLKTGFANFSGVPQAKVLWTVLASGYEPANGSFQVVFGSPSNEFIIYLIPVPPPKYTGLRIFPVASEALWWLVFVPVAALLGALVFLTVLRNPSSREREVREEAEAARAGGGRAGRPP